MTKNTDVVGIAIGGLAYRELTDTQTLIAAECDDLKEMLLQKNLRYGDSAINPIRLFSKADAVEQIKVRLDDKISRLARGTGEETEDVEQDLLGYLILMRVARRLNGQS